MWFTQMGRKTFILVLAAGLASCGKPSEPPQKSPPLAPAVRDAAQEKIDRLTQEVDEQRRALQRARLEVQQAKKNPEDLDRLANANADLLKKVDECLKKIKDLEEAAAAQPATTLPPPKAPPSVDWTEPVQAEPGPTTTPGTDTGTGTPTPTTKEERSNVRDEAIGELLKGVAAAVCVSNPAMCAVVGVLGQILGFLGSTEERDQFLKAVGKVAEGRPLTEQDLANLVGPLKRNFDRLPPDAVRVFAELAKQPDGAAIREVLAQEVERALSRTTPDLKAIVQIVKERMAQRTNPAEIAAAVRDTLTENRFPNPPAKRDVLRWAAALGADDQLIAGLNAIPPQLPPEGR